MSLAHFRFHKISAAHASKFQKDARSSPKVYQISDFGKVRRPYFSLDVAIPKCRCIFQISKIGRSDFRNCEEKLKCSFSAGLQPFIFQISTISGGAYFRPKSDFFTIVCVRWRCGARANRICPRFTSIRTAHEVT